MHKRLPQSALLLLLAASPAFAAQQEPGAMLRQGTWDGGVGTYATPPALARIKPSRWPIDGWHRFTVGGHNIVIEAVAALPRRMPAFLKPIVAQLNGQSELIPPASNTDVADEFYLRVPGVRLRTGPIPLYQFKNGTPGLLPKLDHRYELQLDSQAFALTVRNGLRTDKGIVYGEGAHYTIEYDGRQSRYLLEGFGWDSRITAIGDFDGDGKPDFVIYVGGNNSANEAVLLSSKARPGDNPATASLTATGC